MPKVSLPMRAKELLLAGNLVASLLEKRLLITGLNDTQTPIDHATNATGLWGNRVTFEYIGTTFDIPPQAGKPIKVLPQGYRGKAKGTFQKVRKHHRKGEGSPPSAYKGICLGTVHLFQRRGNYPK